jgi:hypothetical protein
MTGSVQIPLTRAQVDLAGDLYERMETWCAVDDALENLGAHFPGFDYQSVLLKSAAINALYHVRVFGIERVAKHASDVLSLMSQREIQEAGPQLVVELSQPPPEVGKEQKAYRSFASKFAHFFINRNRFYIFDKYVAIAMRRHLKTRSFPRIEQDYERFFTASKALKSSCDGDTTPAEMDRYLWLCGQYREWQKNNDTKLNAEVRELFNSLPDRRRLKLEKLWA